MKLVREDTGLTVYYLTSLNENEGVSFAPHDQNKSFKLYSTVEYYEKVERKVEYDYILKDTIPRGVGVKLTQRKKTFEEAKEGCSNNNDCAGIMKLVREDTGLTDIIKYY